MKKQRNLFIESLKYNTKDFYNSDASRLQAKQKITGSIVDDISHISSNLSMHVTEIAKGGGAEKAGMTKGCIITAIDDITVDSMEALQEQLQYYEKGTTVTLKIQIPQTNGEYKEQTIEVTLQ